MYGFAIAHICAFLETQSLQSFAWVSRQVFRVASPLLKQRVSKNANKMLKRFHAWYWTAQTRCWSVSYVNEADMLAFVPNLVEVLSQKIYDKHAQKYAHACSRRARCIACEFICRYKRSKLRPTNPTLIKNQMEGLLGEYRLR